MLLTAITSDEDNEETALETNTSSFTLHLPQSTPYMIACGLICGKASKSIRNHAGLFLIPAGPIWKPTLRSIPQRSKGPNNSVLGFRIVVM